MEREVAEKYTLLKPVDFGDERITEVSFYEPIGKDIRTMPMGIPSMDEVMKLCVMISTIPSNGVLDRFSRADVQGVLKVTMGFLGDGDSEEEI
jgi:hypothetical protein